MSEQWVPKPGELVLVRGTSAMVQVDRVKHVEKPIQPEYAITVCTVRVDGQPGGLDLPLCDFEPRPPSPSAREMTPEERSLSRRKLALAYLGYPYSREIEELVP